MIRRASAGLVLALGVACTTKPSDPHPADAGTASTRSAKPNPIPAENALTGDPNWYNGREALAGQIQGYASRMTSHAGQTVQVMLSSDAPHSAHWMVYRLGWYGGARARVVMDGASVTVSNQGVCPMEASTGLVQCHWPPSFSFTVLPGWVSGLYLVKFIRDDGFAAFTPFVVTDSRPADLLMQASVDTYQAYNPWQGEDLYLDESGLFPSGLALKVSFDRPYADDRGTGQVLRYEALFAAFLEHYGYDVTYATNVDVANGGVASVVRHGAYLTVGHDEYWSGAERAAVQGARDQGTPALFFGANVGYWKIRYEQNTDATNPRVITCYKADPAQDPVQGANTTGRYRDPPINEPENGLVGAMYESYEWISNPWTVTDPSSFLFAGTGLAMGDQLPFLVGYEYDRTFNNGAEPPVTVVARSPIVDAYGVPSVSEAVTYHAPSGALVFGAASIEWSYGLGQPGVADPRVERMTANVLAAALNEPEPAGVGTGPLPAEPIIIRTHGATSVSTAAHGIPTPTSVGVLRDGSFYVVAPSTHEVFHAGPADTDPVTLIAGDGLLSKKPIYDNVPGLKARFWAPTGIVILPSGDALVADTQNNCLRRITADPTHTVSTVAGGLGLGGYVDGTGTKARFKYPMGLALDPTTNDVLVADNGNHRIRRVNTKSWVVTTEAGSTSGASSSSGEGGAEVGVSGGPAKQAHISAPTAVAVAPDGRIFVVESSYGVVMMIGTDPARTVTTIAGAGRGRNDGPGNVATIAPQGGAVWDGTAVDVSEPATNRIRRITPGTDSSSTTVETLAGSGLFGGLDGTAAQAQLASPLGLAMTTDHNVLVANGGNGTVRLIKF